MLASSRDEERNLHSPNISVNTESIKPQGTCSCAWDTECFGGNYPKLSLTEKYQYDVHKVVGGRCRA